MMAGDRGGYHNRNTGTLKKIQINKNYASKIGQKEINKGVTIGPSGPLIGPMNYWKPAPNPAHILEMNLKVSFGMSMAMKGASLWNQVDNSLVGAFT